MSEIESLFAECPDCLVEVEVTPEELIEHCKIDVSGSLVKSLEKEIEHWLVIFLQHCGSLEAEGNLAGWYDTMYIPALEEAGDRLVALGLYERRPDRDGQGRRQFFRGIKKETK